MVFKICFHIAGMVDSIGVIYDGQYLVAEDTTGETDCGCMLSRNPNLERYTRSKS